MMLVSPKWQTMWMESQHCSKITSNVPVPLQHAKKLLDDLRASCSSPNKAVQLEALKCWGVWINNQNEDDWKLNTMCYAAVRPFLPKLQPLQKDVDVCKLKFSLMWALLRKVENIMQLEGPQYVLEVFLQLCLNWLSSCSGEGGEDVNDLIFQLLLGIFSKEESMKEELFQPLSADILKFGKVFNRLAEKFLNVFVHWKKVQKKRMILKLWKHFLEQCELSCEHVAIPVWHKLFKLVSQMCSEKSEPVRERLGVLHGCATSLRSALSSSKFLDYGNLLMTPCEALVKKLVELCCEECEEWGEPREDAEMFAEAMEVSKVLMVESVAIGGYGLVIDVLNVLDEFSLRSLYWGVWCGLVHCYESLLSNIDQSRLTKIEKNFYRKLRGIAINLELDRNYLSAECTAQVERFTRVLNVCRCVCGAEEPKGERCDRKVETEAMEAYESPRAVDLPPGGPVGQLVPKTFPFGLGKAKRRQKGIVKVNFDLIHSILKAVDVSCVKSLLDGRFRFISLRVCEPNVEPKNISICLKSSNKKKGGVRRSCEIVQKRAIMYQEPEADTEEEISTPKTRSRRRAEEEEKKKEMENQKRKTRKSFEIRVQEIVQKNKERKTEKNCRKSPATAVKEKRKLKQERKTETLESGKKQTKSPKLENYFKVIPKKIEKKETPKKKKNEETNWKQTSLITMIKGKETAEEGVKTRDKEKEGKVKTKVMEGSPLAKLSPFKEVFHDHEYAKKMELKDLKALERVIVNKEEVEKKTAVDESKRVPEASGTDRKCKRAKVREGVRKSKRLSESASEMEKEVEVEVVEENPPNEEDVTETPKGKNMEIEGSKSPEKITEAALEDEEKVKNGTEGESQDNSELHVEDAPMEEAEVLKSPPKEEETSADGNGNVESLNEEEESGEAEATAKRGKKRLRTLDSAKPSKKLHLEDPQEKLETEKENLKEATPANVEKSLKCSPKMISSRALRMIALVPESTRSQIHWEVSPRVEVKKKGPNVDKNSRASKMLALLSENIVREVMDEEEINVEEMKSSGNAPTTPVRKILRSSLKSQKSVKKRRSIRFDDTKNEMVVYEKDTPPSQVLEGKEIRRRIKPSEMNPLNFSIV